MRIRLKGINRITKRLADGTTRTYWYAWKAGPPLRGEPGTPEFVASYNEAAAAKGPSSGKLLSVLQQYQASKDFPASLTVRGAATSLKISSHREGIREISRWLRLPTGERADLQGMAGPHRHRLGRRQADYAWTVLARVLSWGLEPRADCRKSLRARWQALSRLAC